MNLLSTFSTTDRFSWLSHWLRVAACVVLAGLLTTRASGQQVSLPLSSGTGTPGSTVMLSLSAAAIGGAQPAGLQWTMGYPSSVITGVAVSTGSAAYAATKSVQCANASGSTTCVVYGWNTSTIGNGEVATAVFTIAPGAPTASVPVTITSTSATTGAADSIPASGSGGTINVVQSPPPVSLSGLSCTPGSVNAPGSSSCMVTLSAAAPGGGFAVTLSDNHVNVTEPASITVAAGSSSAQFTATVSSVTTDQSAVITASASGVTKTFTLNLVAPAQLSGLSCTPGTLSSGQSATWTVTLTNAATGSGLAVSLSSNNAALPVPAAVTVGSGATTATFAAVAGTVATSQTVTLTASAAGVSKTATVTVNPSDTQAPTAPGNLAAAASAGQINLSWTASTDNLAVTGYLVERCQGAGCTTFTQVAAPTSTTFVDSGLTANTSYTYRTRATDAAGNLSGYCATVSATTPAVASGLVAAYSFNEGTGTTVTDLSGNGNTGTISNASWTTSGMYGNALSFNGTSSYVNLGNPASLQLTGSMTLSAWINAAANPADDGQIVAKANNSAGWQLKTSPDTGPHTFGVAVSRNGKSMTQRYSQVTRSLNTWYHVTGVYDATKKALRIYVNGVLNNGTKVGIIPTSQFNSSVDANIGRRSGGFYFNGIIDEVRIYNRALALAEIQADMITPIGGASGAAQLLSESASLAMSPTSSAATGQSATDNPSGVDAAPFAARNAADPTSEDFCSPGGLASLYGTAFTTKDQLGALAPPLPTNLGGVEVRVNDSPVPLLYAGQSQINFLCPRLPIGSALQVAVKTETGVTSLPYAGVMLAATPALFTLDYSGSGQGVVLIADSYEVAMPRTDGIPSRPARRGEVLTIYANGLGEVEELVPVGSPAPLDHLVRLKNQVRVFLGDVEVAPDFAGLAPGEIGLHQINVPVAAEVPAGSAVPLRVEVVLSDGSTLSSNEVTVAIEQPAPSN